MQVIVSGVAKTMQEVEKYCNCTLLAASLRANQLEGKKGTDLSQTQSTLKSCIDFLLENEFVRYDQLLLILQVLFYIERTG